jgi:hypothetical protein
MTDDERLKSNLRMQSFDDNEGFKREMARDTMTTDPTAMTVEQAIRELDHISLNGPMTANQREAARVVVAKVQSLQSENSALLAKVEHVAAYLDGAEAQADNSPPGDPTLAAALRFIRGIRIVMGGTP